MTLHNDHRWSLSFFFQKRELFWPLFYAIFLRLACGSLCLWSGSHDQEFLEFCRFLPCFLSASLSFSECLKTVHGIFCVCPSGLNNSFGLTPGVFLSSCWRVPPAVWFVEYCLYFYELSRLGDKLLLVSNAPFFGGRCILFRRCLSSLSLRLARCLLGLFMLGEVSHLLFRSLGVRLGSRLWGSFVAYCS